MTSKSDSTDTKSEVSKQDETHSSSDIPLRDASGSDVNCSIDATDVIASNQVETLSDQQSFIDEVSQFYNMADLSDVTIKVRK